MYFNFVNRWGGTPLQDAVRSGRVQLASFLRSRKGLMPESLGAKELCQAAANGDVKTLKLLIECAGIKVNFGGQYIYIYHSF